MTDHIPQYTFTSVLLCVLVRWGQHCALFKFASKESVLHIESTIFPARKYVSLGCFLFKLRLSLVFLILHFFL